MKMVWFPGFVVMIFVVCCSSGVEEGSMPPPGELRESWLPTFKALRDRQSSGDPNVKAEAPFLVKLAKAAYHTNELEVGIESLAAAAVVDYANAATYVSMECDLHYHRSRDNATALPEVARCLRRQFELNPGELAADPAFWESYGRVLLELGRTRLGAGAYQRALEASAARGEGGTPDLPDPLRVAFFAKALLTAGRPTECLTVLGPHLDGWRDAALGGYSLPRRGALRPHGAEEGAEWAAESWHTAALAHLDIYLSGGPGERGGHRAGLSEALYCTQQALALWPDVQSPHAENFHQTLARVYLELGRLDLARAALWGLADLGPRAQASPSAFLRRGFEEEAAAAANEADEGAAEASHSSQAPLCHALGAPCFARGYVACSPPSAAAAAAAADEVRLQHVALLAPGSPAARAAATVPPLSARALLGQCTRAEALAAREDGPQWPKGAGATASASPLAAAATGAAPAGGAAPRGAIVYLCCADAREARDLELSLALLARFFRPCPYPVVVLHDFLGPGAVAGLLRRLGRGNGTEGAGGRALDLRFADLVPEQWHGEVPGDVDPADRIFRYGIGYRHMCRLFSGPPLADHPVRGASRAHRASQTRRQCDRPWPI